jgi:hypothetical protein
VTKKNRLVRLTPGPRDVNVKLVDVSGDEGEGKAELPLENFKTKVKVAEHGVTTPQRHLGVKPQIRVAII